MSDLLDALGRVAMSVQELGEVETHDITPMSVVAPAFFPGGAEMEPHTQGGARLAMVPWWLVLKAGEAESQRDLYRLAVAIWSQLEDEIDGPDCVSRVVSMTEVGSVTVAGSEFWGCKLLVEMFV